MQQRLNITFDNIQEFTPSQLIGNVVQEIDRAIESGWQLNMNSWYRIYANGNCTSCLGGIAVLGLLDFNVDKNKGGVHFLMADFFSFSAAHFCSPERTKDAQMVANLFDSIRRENKADMASHIYLLFDKHYHYNDIYNAIVSWNTSRLYNTEVTGKSLMDLKKDILKLAKILKNNGF